MSAARKQRRAEPVLEVFEAALGARCFRVELLRRGARRVTFTGERTARNTEIDTLAMLQDLARRAGLSVALEVSRQPNLWIGPLDPPAEEEPVNDVGHRLDCGCPVCMPEEYDPAELEAGRGEKTCGADSRKERSIGPAPSGAAARR